MNGFTEARRRMVERQLVTRGVADKRVLSTMLEVPRHLFISEDQTEEAYDDNPLPIGEGQTISQPYMVAIMTELLELTPEARALEIGTGSGYQAAILSRLSRWVYSIERIEALSRRADKALKTCGCANISLMVGDGTMGWPEHAPYDAIVVTAGAPGIPERLVSQLVDGGRLVIPVGDRLSQVLKRVVKLGGRTKIENHTACRFVDLLGKEGWPA